MNAKSFVKASRRISPLPSTKLTLGIAKWSQIYGTCVIMRLQARHEPAVPSTDSPNVPTKLKGNSDLDGLGCRKKFG